MAKKPQAATEQNTNRLTPINKITVKDVWGAKPKVSEIPEGQELALCRMAGFASGVKTGESTYGEWAALRGEFSARNASTGEIFASATCIVPGAMGDMLVKATRDALHEDADAKVKFSVDVSIKVSQRDPEKYEYVVRPVIENALAAPAVDLLMLED